MRHFIVFLILVFGGLFGALYLKKQKETQQTAKPVVKVFASSSFIAVWGPGPQLKSEFEKTCNCILEFFDNADSVITLQRLKSGVISDSVDVVLGLDQFDLEMAQSGVRWRTLSVDNLDFNPRIREGLAEAAPLVPYNWSYLSFVVRKSESGSLPSSVDDLLASYWQGSLALQDPRTSSPGLQFLMWLIQIKGEEGAFQFLKQLASNVHSYSPSWSSSYSLFQKGQAKAVFTYVTSEVYHQIEEKSDSYLSLGFREGHPVQIEYLGVPEICTQCELAESFVSFLLTAEGQRIIMQRNYMLPVIMGVAKGTPFERFSTFKEIIGLQIPPTSERERILKRWSALRRGD